MVKRFSPPFLKKVVFSNSKKGSDFPFNLELFTRSFEIEFTRPISFFVGENGTGKSTILEAIAARCGFSLVGGNRNHMMGNALAQSRLAEHTQLSWLPKVSDGFFMRAESFFDFASNIDEIAESDPSVLMSYGEKSLHKQSHGESFLALFNNRFGGKGLYILDEPEAALSPSRQLAFLSILNRLEKQGESQFIIASHSPILLAYPTATIFCIDNGTIKETFYTETEHYKLTKAFLENPERYFRHLFE